MPTCPRRLAYRQKERLGVFVISHLANLTRTTRSLIAGSAVFFCHARKKGPGDLMTGGTARFSTLSILLILVVVLSLTQPRQTAQSPATVRSLRSCRHACLRRRSPARASSQHHHCGQSSESLKGEPGTPPQLIIKTSCVDSRLSVAPGSNPSSFLHCACL